MTRINELLDKLERVSKSASPEPREQIDGDVCAGCNGIVYVRPGCDWEDDDICDYCVREYFDGFNPQQAQALIQALRACIEGLEGHFGEAFWTSPLAGELEKVLCG